MVENKKLICLDLETTGLDPEDEILQISIIDGDYNVLMNEYVRPEHHDSWPQAQNVNHISPEMVQNKPVLKELASRIAEILSSAEIIVGYNIGFDMSYLTDFLPDHEIAYEDVMLQFAPIYGQWSEERNGYKWQKLTTCAAYFGYSFHAHDSLEDARATLYSYKRLCNLKQTH